MARLPDLITESIEVGWPEDYKSKSKDMFSILAQLMRTRKSKDRSKNKEDSLIFFNYNMN